MGRTVPFRVTEITTMLTHKARTDVLFRRFGVVQVHSVSLRVANDSSSQDMGEFI